MSYSDNLENNLKALESREEKDPEKAKRDQERREADRSAALKRAPYAEALKKSAFTGELMTQCRMIGHGQRVLVQFTWLGENLRLDAKTKRLELMPTSDGIIAVFFKDGSEVRQAKVDPERDDASALAKEWLTAE
jgi:hypothetical protein